MQGGGGGKGRSLFPFLTGAPPPLPSSLSIPLGAMYAHCCKEKRRARAAPSFSTPLSPFLLCSHMRWRRKKGEKGTFLIKKAFFLLLAVTKFTKGIRVTQFLRPSNSYFYAHKHLAHTNSRFFVNPALWDSALEEEAEGGKKPGRNKSQANLFLPPFPPSLSLFPPPSLPYVLMRHIRPCFLLLLSFCVCVWLTESPLSPPLPSPSICMREGEGNENAT